MFNIPETLKFETDLIDQGVLPRPRMAIIHNTYKCNQACNYCFFHEYNYEHQKAGLVMPTTKLMSLIDELALFGVRSIQFCGGGEPLIAPDMDKVIDHTAARGLKIGVITNGVQFHNRVMESIVNNATWVRIGLDTVDPKLYEKVRGMPHCGLVLENIKNALRYKNRIKSNCDISIKVTLFKEQTHEKIQEVFKYFDKSGISNIQIKHVWDNEGNYLNPGIDKESIGKLESHGNMIVRKTHYQRYMNERCWLNPVQTTIDAKGDMFLCCYYQGRDEEHRIGNVNENKFAEIWGSPLHKDKMRNIDCKQCVKHDCRFLKYQGVIRRNQKLGTWDFV